MRHAALVKAFALVSSVALVAAGFWLGKNVPFEKQWPLYEALRATAAIIFAVVGAWLAIIYPERLRFSGRGTAAGASSAPERGEGIGRFFTPIAHSTAILCLILLIGIIAPMVRQIPFVIQHVSWARSLSYGILVLLTLWQLWTVVLTLIPADEIKRASDREDRRHLLTSPITKMGSVGQRPEDNNT